MIRFFNFKKIKEGVTLIEVLLYMVLFVVVFSLLFSTLYFFYSNKISNRTILEVEQQGQIASMILSYEIRNAQSIISPATGESSDQLILEGMDPLKSPLIFFLEDDYVIMREGGDDTKITTSRVRARDLNFINISSGDISSIDFSFNFSYKSESLRHEHQHERSFSGTTNLLKK
jgi:type II secretory pathway component PulJ